MKVLALLSFMLFSSVSMADQMKVSCEGHATFKKRICEVEVSVDTNTSGTDGNLQGSGRIKCYERDGKIIHEGSLSEFLYIGMPNGAFELDAQSPTNPYEVPVQKASVKIDMSSHSNKSTGIARFFNGSVFKEMSIDCEFK